MRYRWFLPLALLLAVGMIWLVHRRLAERRVPERTGRIRPVTVEATPVVRATLFDEAHFVGSLVARSQFVVSSKIPGRLQTLAVDIGDSIRHGDLIALLDSEEYRYQAQQARAELEVSEAALAEARSARALAASELQRVRSLHAEGIASDAKLEDIKARWDAADARVNLAQAQIRQRRASLQGAEVRLSYTRLYAQWDSNMGGTWYVAERFADAGTMLRANDPVVSVVDHSTLRAVVHAIERDYAAVQPGQRAVLRTDVYPEEPFEGFVARRAPVLDQRTLHARVEIEVPNLEGRLVPGMFIRAQIRFGSRPDVLVIPLAALTRRNGRQGVFQVDKDTMTARFVEVETGIQSDDQVELAHPDLTGKVVTLGHHLLEDGGTVIIAPGDEVVPEKVAPEQDKGRRADGEGGRL